MNSDALSSGVGISFKIRSSDGGVFMRLFIAIDFSQIIKNELEETMSELKRQGMTGNYIDPESTHLTLAFLGETKTEKAQEIAEILRSLPVPHMQISFSSLGHFGDLYWIGVQENPVLKKYVSDLRKALDNAGISYDRKPFRPHVTIVRRAHVKEKPAVAFPEQEMDVSEVLLMRSDRINGRMKYTPIASSKSGFRHQG